MDHQENTSKPVGIIRKSSLSSIPAYPTGNDLFAWKFAAKKQQHIVKQDRIYDHPNQRQLHANPAPDTYSLATQSFSAKKNKKHVHFNRSKSMGALASPIFGTIVGTVINPDAVVKEMRPLSGSPAQSLTFFKPCSQVADINQVEIAVTPKPKSGCCPFF